MVRNGSKNMSELLLELFSEEIPAMMQKPAAEGYKKIFTAMLQESSIDGDVQVFTGSRRITIYIKNLPNLMPAKEVVIRGPKVSAPAQAIEGFCRSNNIKQDDLVQISVQGQIYYEFVKKTPATNIQILLKNIIPKAIARYVWPKSMRWGEHDMKWIRPLRNILCIFDSELLEIQYGHLTANNITYGHRFLAPEAIEINSFAQYQDLLKDKFVIIDQAERRQMIEDGLTSLAQTRHLTIRQDDRLLEEVTGLVEYPTVMIGRIADQFMSLPKEALVSSMRTHQKYFSSLKKFATYNEFGIYEDFAPFFLFVSNMLNEDIIVAGNEKVLNARLADAQYFFDQDRTCSLESRLAKLEKITFYAGLGNLKQKTDRIVEIGRFKTYQQPRHYVENLIKAAELCKTDLTTEMVGEFPELQGIIGYYYAQAEGLEYQITEAIRDHYLPHGSTGRLPDGGIAIVLALLDKLDSLVGFFLIGQAPTGSRDPYALKQQASAIIRLMLALKTSNIKELIGVVINVYIESLGVEITEQEVLKSNILNFLQERARYHFNSEGYDQQLVKAVVNFDIEESLEITARKLEYLKDFLAGDGANLPIIYKRADNILKGNDIVGELDSTVFTSEYEIQLFQILENIAKPLDGYIKQLAFDVALIELLKILNPLNEFFDNVMVKDPDPKIANNRLLLLKMVTQLFDKVAKFELL